jgi:hypothetical protein
LVPSPISSIGSYNCFMSGMTMAETSEKLSWLAALSTDSDQRIVVSGEIPRREELHPLAKASS